MTLRLYIDLMSQPCRAVTLFARATALPVEEVVVAIRKGEHLSEKFTRINPFNRLPAMDHDGFKITESVAMLQYLCRTFPVPDHWYPLKDFRKLASIDSYMAWQHLNLRISGSQYFRSSIPSLSGGEAVDEAKLAKYGQLLNTVLDQMETIWLKDRLFIATDEISIADLLAVTELEQPGMVGYDVRAGHPKLSDYMDLVKSRLQPHYDQVHSIVYMTKQKLSKLKESQGV